MTEEPTEEPPADDPPVTPATQFYTVTGVIQVRRKTDDVLLGILDTATTQAGQIKYTTSTSSALKVQVSLEVGKTAGTGIELTLLVCLIVLQLQPVYYVGASDFGFAE